MHELEFVGGVEKRIPDQRFSGQLCSIPILLKQMKFHQHEHGLDVACIAVFQFREDGERLVHLTGFHIEGSHQAKIGQVVRLDGANGLEFGKRLIGSAERPKVPVLIHVDLGRATAFRQDLIVRFIGTEQLPELHVSLRQLLEQVKIVGVNSERISIGVQNGIGPGLLLVDFGQGLMIPDVVRRKADGNFRIILGIHTIPEATVRIGKRMVEGRFVGKQGVCRLKILQCIIVGLILQMKQPTDVRFTRGGLLTGWRCAILTHLANLLNLLDLLNLLNLLNLLDLLNLPRQIRRPDGIGVTERIGHNLQRCRGDGNRTRRCHPSRYHRSRKPPHQHDKYG